MVTSIAVYHRSVPNKKNQEKIDILRFFAQGAKILNESVIDVNDYEVRNTEVAIIQGWIAPGQLLTPHGDLRKRVIDTQLSRGKFVISADSNLFLYANTENPFHYLRYSFNGIFPSTGLYCDSNIDPDRWKRVSKDLNLNLKDYRKNGNHILLCLQRNGGWSMGAVDSQAWALNTIAEIRKYSDRPIVIRLHPGDKETKRIFKAGPPLCKIKFDYGITLSQNENLIDDLKNCWAAVNHNSSPIVGAAIEGIPVFVTDAENSQCKDIANIDFSLIENPQLLERQRWVERLSMFHWKFDELKSGECWEHMKKYIKLNYD
jgi:hypothetical protein